MFLQKDSRFWWAFKRYPRLSQGCHVNREEERQGDCNPGDHLSVQGGTSEVAKSVIPHCILEKGASERPFFLHCLLGYLSMTIYKTDNYIPIYYSAYTTSGLYIYYYYYCYYSYFGIGSHIVQAGPPTLLRSQG